MREMKNGEQGSDCDNPTQLRIEDLDAELIGDFLVHVETARQNRARSRNTRLAAIRSFFRYVAMNEPAHPLYCQRILTMPGKRYVRQGCGYSRTQGLEKGDSAARATISCPAAK
jgi:hypothetical protein